MKIKKIGEAFKEIYSQNEEISFSRQKHHSKNKIYIFFVLTIIVLSLLILTYYFIFNKNINNNISTEQNINPNENQFNKSENPIIKNNSNNTKNQIQNDNEMNDYSGGYTGQYKQEIGDGEEGYELVTGTIYFYKDNDKFYKLENGVLLDNFNVKNTLIYYAQTTEIFGEFNKQKEKDGFTIYCINDNNKIEKYFLAKKISNEDAIKIVQESIKEYRQFKSFFNDFLNAYKLKDETGIIKMINFPFYDKRYSWDKPTVYNNKDQLKLFLRDLFASKTYSNDFFRNADNDGNFPGLFAFDMDEILLLFGKIDGEFKLIQATMPFD